jgi:hypothetical protein
MFGKSSKNRFEVVHKEKVGVLSGCKVLVDKEEFNIYLVGTEKALE